MRTIKAQIQKKKNAYSCQLGTRPSTETEGNKHLQKALFSVGMNTEDPNPATNQNFGNITTSSNNNKI